MNRIRITALAVGIFASACGGSSSPSSCAEYASDIRAMMDREASAEEMTRFVEDTEEQVARLIAEEPDRAGPCVEAVLEAVFVSGFAELEQMFDEQLP